MLNQHFYHEKIRKCVAVFGTMFNNINIIRKDASGQPISQLKVPLSFAPKEKFLDRIREHPELADDTKMAIKLPRMSFEITSIMYDPSRQLPKVNAFTRVVAEDDTIKTKFYTAAPYILNFQLSILSKTHEDAVQIVEQILPYFAPSFTVTIRPFGGHVDIKEDIPISLVSTAFSDGYEGQLEDRRTIMYDLDFEMKTNFYGPLSDSKIIRQAHVDFKQYPEEITGIDSADFALGTDDLYERISVNVFPLDVDPDSDYSTRVTILSTGRGDSI